MIQLQSKYYYFLDDDGILMAGGTLTGDYRPIGVVVVGTERYALVQCVDTDTIYLI